MTTNPNHTAPYPQQAQSSTSQPLIPLEDVGFVSRVRWLLYKNYKTSLATPCSFICKLFIFPVVFLIVWWQVLDAVGKVQHAVGSDLTLSSDFSTDLTGISTVNDIASFDTIAVVPRALDGSPAYQQLVHHMQSGRGPRLQQFQNTQALNAMVRSHNISQLKGAIIFEQHDAASMDFSQMKNMHYTIKLPSNEMPTLQKYAINDVPTPRFDVITRKGYNIYAGIKAFADDAIYETMKNALNTTQNTIYDELLPSGNAVRFQMIPQTFQGVKPIWGTYTRPIMDLTLSLSQSLLFTILFLMMTSALISEKRRKLKQMLAIYGVGTVEYWTSYFVWFLIQSSITVAFCVGFHLFGNVILPKLISSDFSIIFMLLMVYAINISSLAFLASTLFDSTRLCSTISVLLSITCYAIGTFCPTAVTATFKHWFSLLSPAAFSLGLHTIYDLEYLGDGATWSNISKPIWGYSVAHAFAYLAVETVVYLLLAVYFDNVLPSKYKARKHPLYFVYELIAHFKNRSSTSEEIENKDSVVAGSIASTTTNVEHHDPTKFELIGDNKRPVAIRVRDMMKKFGKFSAVDNLWFDVYEGEVYGLLGHNGAGKTTTLNILAGLDFMNSGTVTVNDMDLATQFKEIRKTYGFCPQFDILWETLSVYDSMSIVAGLKGVPKLYHDAEIKRVLFSVGMSNFTTAITKTLSGGEKRKVSLAMCLLGDSKILFLDEPTAGMDVEARRGVWSIINNLRLQRKTVILCSHFMDEVEVLTDRVGIMVNGQMKVSGSSQFLKQKYGVGYTLAITLDESVNPNSMVHRIESLIASVVAETRFEGCFGQEMMFKFAFEASGKFPALFKLLDDNMQELQIVNYGIANTNLEDVFIQVGEEADNEAMTAAASTVQTTSGGDGQAQLELQIANNAEHAMQQEMVDDSFHNEELQQRSILMAELHSFLAVLYKRLMIYVRSPSDLINVYLCPALLAFVGIVIYVLMCSIYPDTSIGFATYADPSTHIVPLIHSNAAIANQGQVLRDWNEAKIDALFGKLEVYPSTATHAIDYAHSYNSLEMTTPATGTGRDAVFAYKGTAYEGLAGVMDIRANMKMKSLLLASDDNRAQSFEVRSKIGSLVRPRDQQSSLQWGGKLVVVSFFCLALFVLTWSGVDHVLAEKTIKEHQFMGGITIIGYHMANMLWNLFLPFVFLGVLFGVFAAFDMNPWTRNEMEHQRGYQTAGSFNIHYMEVIFFFFVASIGYIQCLSHIISKSWLLKFGPLIIFYVVNQVSGVVLQMILSTAANNRDPQAAIDNMFSAMKIILILLSIVCPLVPLCTLLVILTPEIEALLLTALSSASGNEHAERTMDNLISMYLSTRYALIAVAVFYPLLAILVEHFKVFYFSQTQATPYFQKPNEDSDVAQERQMVYQDYVRMQNHDVAEQTQPVYDTHVVGLKKHFGQKYAVDDVTFGVKKNEIFGLLGTNGAGKSTLLKCLLGVHKPSSGDASIAGMNIYEQWKVRANSGYCGQDNNLFESLTVTDHLAFYAISKGVFGARLSHQVKVLTQKLHLHEYADKRALTLSGGNKRKLSTAIAMVGSPRFLLLDEPTTGVDPHARRHIWRFIQYFANQRSVILTTHAMEECEALAHRLTIMVDGKLKCIGNKQHLKNKYSNGYTVVVRVKHELNEQECVQAIAANIQRKYRVASFLVNGKQITFQVAIQELMAKKEHSLLGDLFNCLEQNKQFIEDYVVKATDLESIFIAFANQAQRNQI